MTKCSIIKCGSKKDSNHPRLTLHRLPGNKSLRKIWLDAIGSENINPNKKKTLICSLHFEESCFNRTLDVARLHHNSIPSLHLQADAGSTTHTRASEPLDEDDVLSQSSNEEDSRKQTTPAKQASVATAVCPNCNTEVNLEDIEAPMVDTRTIIAKVYHFLEREYLALQKRFEDLDLSPLLKFRARTAEATGVSEKTVSEILKEEQELNKVLPRVKRARKRKRDIDILVQEEREQAESGMVMSDIKLEASDDETYRVTKPVQTAAQRVRDHRALKKLLQDFQLSAGNQKSTSELAKRFGKMLTVRTRQYRARLKLRRTSGSPTGDQHREQAGPDSDTLAVHTEPADDHTYNLKPNFLLIDAGKIMMRQENVEQEPEEYAFHENEEDENNEDPDIKIEEIEITEEGFT